ncbi:MAG: CDP-alcohol phosphatidyltransferase family protein [Alphaproteobacteria bacterium]
MTGPEVRKAEPAVAVLLAAGKGTRICTKSRGPKPIARVLGLSLAERVVCTFLKDLGVRRFVVVVGHEAEIVKSHFRDIALRRGATVKFVEPDDWRRGNGASALSARGRTGETPFYLSMTDHLFAPEIGRVLARHAPAEGQVCLAVDKDKSGVFDPEDATRVKVDGDRIREIAKDLEDWDAADTGVLLCSEALFDGLERAAARGMHGLCDGLRELAREGRAIAVDVTGHDWLDVDTPEAVREAERRVMSQQGRKISDGPVARYLNRPVSRWLTRYLVRTAVTPNQISIASWLLACVAAALFVTGGYPALAAGGVVAQLASIVDGCDGEVARLRREQSDFGGWFDAILDRYADAFLLFGLTWHEFAATGTQMSLVIGVAAIIGAFVHSYTADKYDGMMTRKLRGAPYFRPGRDVRTFVIFLGALLNGPLLALAVIAVMTNVDVVRRIILCAREEKA